MDVFHHVNHAAVITLLEEARVALLFCRARQLGLSELAEGIVLSRLEADYYLPVDFTDGSLLIELSVQQLKHASFVVKHVLHTGSDIGDPIAVIAQATLVPYHVSTRRPRRLTAAEREFLAGFVEECVG